jgi:hypothetical protein
MSSARIPVARWIERLPSMRRAGLIPRSRCAGSASYSFKPDTLKPTDFQTVGLTLLRRGKPRFAKPLYLASIVEKYNGLRNRRLESGSGGRTRTFNLPVNSGVTEGTRTADLLIHSRGLASIRATAPNEGRDCSISRPSPGPGRCAGCWAPATCLKLFGRSLARAFARGIPFIDRGVNGNGGIYG